MGLFEILLIAVVTLLVVGPERMPQAVRSTVLNIGRVKRMLNNARQEIEKQVGADEIRQQLHNENVMENLARVEKNIEHSIGNVNNSLDNFAENVISQDSTSKDRASQDNASQDSASQNSSHEKKSASTGAVEVKEDENNILGERPSSS